MNKLNLSVLVVVIFFALSLSACREQTPSACAGKQWKNSEERHDCLWPYPPIGRWHAVYSKEFAKTHNLPEENISKDLSAGVDYMEMEVTPFNDGLGTACLVNMFVKKPHDIAFYHGDIPVLPADRKLTHLIDIDYLRGDIKGIASFSSASRDYKIEKSGYEGSTFAMYVEDALPNYDYISAHKHCRDISMKPQYFPKGYAFWVEKASVWGKYKQKFHHMDMPERPKSDKDFQNAHFFINIPHELVSTIFKDVPIGGR